MKFIDAIREGIKNAEDYNINKNEIFSVFEEANKAIFDKTKHCNGFIKITDSGGVHCIGFIKSCELSRKCAYPVTLKSSVGDFVCHDKDDLISNISDIMSSASFGFYVRKIMRN